MSRSFAFLCEVYLMFEDVFEDGGLTWNTGNIYILLVCLAER